MTYLKIMKMFTHSTTIYQISAMCQSLFPGLRHRSEKKTPERKKEKNQKERKKRISELEGENSKHLK